MQNVEPCPYCGGEIEIVKLIKKKEEKFQPYRIECRKCRRLVARGTKFEIETKEQGQKRIDDYNKEMARIWSPLSSTKIRQSQRAQERDAEMARSSRISLDDEEYEMHDASHCLFAH